MSHDEDLDAIVELGRRTRQPTPRWLWVVAVVVGAICVTCFTVMLAGERQVPSHAVDRRPAASSGLGIGLVIGAGAGLVIGFSIGRQRRDHSSRKSP